MNTKINCQSCEYCKDGYCENLELKPCYPQEGCDYFSKRNEMNDAISRQAVLDLIEHYNSDGLDSVFYVYEDGVKFADAVNKLPSVNVAKFQKCAETRKEVGDEHQDQTRNQ